MAARVSSDHFDVLPATTKRALGYLRWYPSAWRERYGEEFVAHLEVELTERPVSIARTCDIVAHGIVARLSYQRGFRIALRTTTAVVFVVATVVGVVAATRYWAPVTFASGRSTGQSGVGLFARPSQVADVSFNFSTHSRVAIRITSVTVVPLRGFPVPQVVGVDFAAHASELINGRGWPIHLPKSLPAQEGNVPLIPAIGTTVTLAPSDALWLGLRAPSLGRAYAAEGLRVTYERRGLSHSMTLSQFTTPDVICSSSSGSVQMPQWCSQEVQAANTIATFLEGHRMPITWPAAEAQIVSQLALNNVGTTNPGVPGLRVVRHWAARLFPASSARAIQAVTGVIYAGVPEWRFVIRQSSGHSTVVRCVTRGRVTAGGGVIGVGAASCPLPTAG